MAPEESVTGKWLRRLCGIREESTHRWPANTGLGMEPNPEAPDSSDEKSNDDRSVQESSAHSVDWGRVSIQSFTDDEDVAAPCPEDIIARKTLWLIRHGQAVHNIEENRAKRRAAEEAKAAGCDPTSEAFKDIVEAARKAALSNVHLHDAPLSEDGKAQVQAAKEIIDELVDKRGLSMPTRVLTSPLQRTLQTTAIIFPGHPGVHMRECLRERRTGLPCDERQSASLIRSRPSFAFMSSFNLVAMESQGLAGDSPVETKPKLRCRTLQIIDELLRFEDDSICVVTHKGCLRELERGPLGRSGATEFGNCEVRAYDIAVRADGQMVATLISAGDDPAGALDNPGCDGAMN